MTMPAFSIGRLIALVVFILAVIALFGALPIPAMLLIGALALAVLIG